MADTLRGKTVLITGASSGIGRETAYELAAAGADVALAARRLELLEQIETTIESRHGVAALPVKTDVRDPTAVRELIEETVDEFGGIDVVVSNAGRTCPGEFESVPLDAFRGVTGVNITGAFLVAQEALPHLRRSEGILIFVGSFAGKYPRPFNPVYAATKWWLRGFALSLAGQIGGDQIGISLINPTEVRTEIGSSSGTPMKEAFDPGEVTEPDEVANAIAFAAEQEPPNAVTELDLFRRDKFCGFD